ncbi:hypothetical protein EDD22DRAFT_846662 [Suillus occidentalis]|nr:hypothetical protein EDD22DRAFT_846662 [Suillus occidentalis]
MSPDLFGRWDANTTTGSSSHAAARLRKSSLRKYKVWKVHHAGSGGKPLSEVNGDEKTWINRFSVACNANIGVWLPQRGREKLITIASSHLTHEISACSGCGQWALGPDIMKSQFPQLFGIATAWYENESRSHNLKPKYHVALKLTTLHNSVTGVQKIIDIINCRLQDPPGFRHAWFYPMKISSPRSSFSFCRKDLLMCQIFTWRIPVNTPAKHNHTLA